MRSSEVERVRAGSSKFDRVLNKSYRFRLPRFAFLYASNFCKAVASTTVDPLECVFALMRPLAFQTCAVLRRIQLRTDILDLHAP